MPKPTHLALLNLPLFWAKVDKTEDGCWLWNASKDSKGYGQIKVGGVRGRLMRAHRISYELCSGAIPEGLVLDHLCRVRHCVNPAHLEPVTQRENSLRGTGPAAWRAALTHCQRGHEFTPENTYIPPDRWPTGRRCRICLRDRDRWRSLHRDQSRP